MASQYDAAVAAIDSGDVETLRRLLGEEPELVNARGESNTPLLVQVIDWPGHRPRAAESARALLEAGADVGIRKEPRNEPWGLREFEIEDPDGNWFIFTGPVPDSDTDQSESGTSD